MEIIDLEAQKLRSTLKDRVIAMDCLHKKGNLQEIEDAWQYGDKSALQFFDRILNRDSNLYAIHGFFLNTARMIDVDITPSLTEDHMRAFFSIPGGSLLNEDQQRDIMQVILNHPEDLLLISSILRERRIFDPKKIEELVAEQKESATAFSSGAL